MKRIFYGLVFGCVLVAGAEEKAPVTAPVNLVKNASFEEGVKFWDRRVRAGKNGEKPAIDFTIVEEGVTDKSSARINSLKGGGMAIAEFSQLIPVKPDCEYYASLDVKVLRPGSWQAAYIEHRNAARSQIAFTPFTMTPEVKKLPAGQWRKQECRFKTKPDQRFVSVSLRLQHLGAGEVLYDNIKLVEVK